MMLIDEKQTCGQPTASLAAGARRSRRFNVQIQRALEFCNASFQLHDSLPVTRRAEFEAILKESDDSAKRRKLEVWLDRGHGECWLRRHDVAEPVERVLLEADGRDYRMQAWVVMPHHLHLVVDVRDVPLVS